ncbi:hypothetical protein [Helicobacter bizzozeronii]|uniref:hypothetical protein n=1 Tax=Helicobacter bizzozeronii TaxID=56877 RepID=UPI001F39E5A5|nr:hypothetical protein [Helicobacter bizzozeronii]
MRALILLVLLIVLGFAKESPTLKVELKTEDNPIPPALIQGVTKMRANMVSNQLDALTQFGAGGCEMRKYDEYLSNPAIDLVDFGADLLKDTPLGQELLQKLEPYGDGQKKEFLKNFKQFEGVHLLYLVENSSSYYCSPVIKYKATPQQIAQDFFDSINFIYTPLIQAYKVGLDPIAYLRSLNSDALWELICQDCNINQTLQLYLNDPNLLGNKPTSVFLQHLEHDIKAMVSANKFWQALSNGKIVWANLALSAAGSTDEFIGTKDDPYTLFSTYYLARTAFLLLHANSYINSQYIDTKELQEHPTLCLNPRYLSSKYQQTCLQVFKAQTYNRADLNNYLKTMRLVAIDAIPCMYLDSKDKVQALRSKNTLCLALQEHFIQRTPFSKAFRALYHYMDQPNRKIISGLNMDEGWKFMRVAGQIPGYIKGVIPLAQTAIQQIPLYQEFKPKNKAETQFLAHLKQREMLRALDMIDKYQNKDDESYHLKSALATQQFLDTATLIYAPLFNAKKAGLDPIAYLKELQHILVDKKKCDPTLPKPDDDDDKKTCMARAHATLSAGEYNISDNQSLEKLHRALKNLDDAYQFFKPDISSRGLWERLTLAHLLGDDKENNKDVPPAYYADDNIYGNFLHHYQPKIDPSHFSALYLARILVFSHNALFYDRLKDDDPTILKNHPTMCLNPKYLSPKSKQTCLQLFKTQSYNAKDIQEQLHLVRLISIDDSPCVYLNSQDKLQVFKSDDAICLVLQKHLTKE